MSKYEEIPIDDTKGNPFKVGDAARIYDQDWPKLNPDENWKWFKDGEIVKVSGDIVRIDHDNGSVSAHWKQVRKLEEVRPREIKYCFLHETKIYTRGPQHYECDVAKLREVLDEIRRG